MQHFPFSAVVGSDDLALSLILTTVSPSVGGVLVRGEKGTAKSTMVRALAALLPPVTVADGCRFSCDPAEPDRSCPDGPHASGGGRTRPARLVELPVGATEDRVIGSLQLAKALSSGVTEYEPGLLADAHRGLLYVDEVNLLHDHLVDLLLDAAAMGRSTVERDGVSVAHASRFVLVGTMNPEEGELRPQLLDRFGLSVEVAAPRDPSLRVQVVRRRLAYEADPVAFAARFEEAERSLAERIVKAQALLPSVVLGDAALEDIARICAAFEVDGMRADLVTARAAIAHAAWEGRTDVTRDDVRAAARLALPHRRRRNPFDAPGIDNDVLDEALGPDEGPDDEPEPDPDGPGEGSPPPVEPDDRPQGELARPSVETNHQANDPYRTQLFSVAGAGRGEAGKRSRAITSTGQVIGSRVPHGDHGPVHVLGTLIAAARDGGVVRPEHVRLSVKEGRESNLVLLCVDASGSMAAHKRMEQVKTAVLSLLMDAYQRRDKVGLVTFRGSAAELALPPTGSVEIAARRLAELPAGGRTPLAEGLLRAAETIRLEHLKDPRRRPLLVVVTDGRATSGADPVVRAHQVARYLADTGVHSVVIDCESGRMRMGLAVQLAEHLRAEYVAVGDVSADSITAAVRAGRAA
ncbi:MAG TPA: magnesium chelatase subunit D family protein [Nocardioidaceae bacterium]|nr:magnesium chelatase subunit D family protein [Nocardioidaceae bacterium]